MDPFLPTLGMLPGIPTDWYGGGAEQPGQPELGQPYAMQPTGFGLNPYWQTPPQYQPPPMQPWQMPGWGQPPPPPNMGGMPGWSQQQQRPQMPQASQPQQPQARASQVTGYNNVSAQRGPGAAAMSNPAQQIPGRPDTSPGYSAANGGLGMSNPDNTKFKEDLNYNPDNPTLALSNVLREQGRNPSNPGDLFSKFMQRSAAGLGLAYQISQAIAGATGGSESVLNPGKSFQSFLSDHLGKGDVFGTLEQGAHTLQGPIVDMIRQLGGEGQNIGSTNPYLQALADMMSSKSGAGTGDAMAALLGPGMNASAFGGLRSGYQTANENALRQYDPNDKSKDIWSYLLGH